MNCESTSSLRHPTLVLVTGPPGTGKSSLADRAATALGASVLGWDWVMAGLTDFETVQAALGAMPRPEQRRLGWSVMWNLALAQLRRGCSVVLDGVARDIEVAGTRSLGQSVAAPVVVALTDCTDVLLHRSRVEGRDREIPGWHELSWDNISRFLDQWVPPTDVDVRLDATSPLDENLSRLLATVARAHS